MKSEIYVYIHMYAKIMRILLQQQYHDAVLEGFADAPVSTICKYINVTSVAVYAVEDQ